jgi:hypothetical protein
MKTMNYRYFALVLVTLVSAYMAGAQVTDSVRLPGAEIKTFDS